MLYFLTVIYCPWPPQHLWLLGAFFLMLQAARLNYGFLLLPLISCDCYCAWSQVTGGQRKEKKRTETCSHSSHHCSSGQAKWFFPLPQDFSCRPPPPLPHYCLWERLKRRKKETRTRGFPRPLSLTVRGILISWIRNKKFHLEDFTWSSSYQPLVHTSEFLAAFGSRLCKTGGKKNGKLTAGLVELWILVSFPNLRATIYVSGPSESCSIRSVQNL